MCLQEITSLNYATLGNPRVTPVHRYRHARGACWSSVAALPTPAASQFHAAICTSDQASPWLTLAPHPRPSHHPDQFIRHIRHPDPLGLACCPTTSHPRSSHDLGNASPRRPTMDVKTHEHLGGSGGHGCKRHTRQPVRFSKHK